MSENNKAKQKTSPSQSRMKFQITESFKMIRTNLIYSFVKIGCKTIVISSPMASEGKSTCSANIALSFAQTNARILLIDGDLRKPKVHRFFNLENKIGLTNLLGQEISLEEALQKTNYPNFQILTSGVIPPNPSEILSSEQMADLIHLLEERYDFIIIDSPPINIVSDAVPLAKLSDGVVLVVRENRSTYAQLDAAIDHLNLIGAKVLGSILNATSAGRKGKYGDKKYYGKYGYDRYGYGKYGYGD